MLQIEHSPRRANIFTLKDLMRCDILQAVMILGLTGCFIQMVTKSIQLSIQSLQYSYNFNLFVIGLSNLLGYLTASNSFFIQFTSSESSRIASGDSSLPVFSTEPLPWSSFFPSALRTGLLRQWLSLYCDSLFAGATISIFDSKWTPSQKNIR